MKGFLYMENKNVTQPVNNTILIAKLERNSYKIMQVAKKVSQIILSSIPT